MSVMEQELVRTRRLFTDEFRRDAVAMVLDDGNRIVDVADRLVSVRARWGTGCVGPASTGALGADAIGELSGAVNDEQPQLLRRWCARRQVNG